MSELRDDEKPELDRAMSSFEKRLQSRLLEARQEIERLKELVIRYAPGKGSDV